jgi:hypothetical protein
MKLCPKCNKQFSDDANFCPVDAARLNPLEAGQAAGATDALSTRFELGDKLGGGHTGTVFRARDKQGTVAAVKLVAPAVVALPGVAQRLERELKQLERVQSAGVAKILTSGKRGEETWVAMELLEGAQTLAEAISARGPIALDQASHLIEVIGEALIEAAQVGVVHRDLAPKNVLFAGQDIKLINFSLPVPTTDKVPGVPEFVAPEQVEGKPVDQRSNLYSLGALYYYVLTGQAVHAGSVDEVHRAHVGGSIRTPSSLAPVPAPVEAVIMRALDRSPTKRFLTVRQFVDEVGRIARGESDPKSTAAMGKVGRPKAELVQTLLGVRSGGQAHIGMAAPAAMPTGVPAPAAMPAAAMAPAAPLVPATMMGIPPSPLGEPTPAKQAPAMPAAVAVAQPSPVAMPGAERSPWAAPVGAGAPAAAPTMVAPPVVAPPVVAPPVVAPPVVAPPVVSAPHVAAAPAGKAKSAPKEETKGKFRETMWFKKGELDVQAAENAAAERQKTGKDVATDKADSLPIDERYKDDGSISRGDKEKYSLRTGATQMMAAIRGDVGGDSGSKVSEDALIGEMKGGRTKIIVGIVAALLVIVIIVIVAR